MRERVMISKGEENFEGRRGRKDVIKFNKSDCFSP